MLRENDNKRLLLVDVFTILDSFDRSSARCPLKSAVDGAMLRRRQPQNLVLTTSLDRIIFSCA